MSESRLVPYLERNAAFSAADRHRAVPEIPFVPLGQLYLITCIDPRVEPAAILGLGLGEGIVARNLGGRVTPALIRDLAWVVHLHEQKTPDAGWFDVAVIHHNDCGSGLLADDELRTGYVARGGWDDESARAMAVLDPAVTVAADVATLKAAPELASAIDQIRIGGYTYDVDSGRLTTIVEPGR